MTEEPSGSDFRTKENESHCMAPYYKCPPKKNKVFVFNWRQKNQHGSPYFPISVLGNDEKSSSLIIQGGPKVGIQLLNYFLCALKLLAVHFMWPKSRYTVNGENYLEILREVVVPQLQTKPDFDELFFQQDGAPPH